MERSCLLAVFLMYRRYKGVTDGVSPSTAVSLQGKSVRVRESTVKFQAAENEVHNISINAPAGSTVRVNITDSGEVVSYQNVKADNKVSRVFMEW